MFLFFIFCRGILPCLRPAACQSSQDGLCMRLYHLHLALITHWEMLQELLKEKWCCSHQDPKLRLMGVVSNNSKQTNKIYLNSTYFCEITIALNTAWWRHVMLPRLPVHSLFPQMFPESIGSFWIQWQRWPHWSSGFNWRASKKRPYTNSKLHSQGHSFWQSLYQHGVT